jgi:plastocyanin
MPLSKLPTPEAWMRPFSKLFALATLALLPMALAMASSTITVVQKNREFQTMQLTVAPGDTVQFTNEDEFLHQIYASSDKFTFDSDEQAPGDIIDVSFPVPGSYEVRCGIHPRMLLKINVE